MQKLPWRGEIESGIRMADVSRYETLARIVDWLSACKHRRNPRNSIVTTVLAGLTLFAMNSPAQSVSTSSVERFTFRRIEMGVEFRIEVYGCDSRAANKAATAAFDRVRQLNAVMSDYTSDSEVRRLCDGDHRQRPVLISSDLYRVLAESVSLWKDTDGAFDVTVGPLTKLWRRARRRGEMPPLDQLTTALSAVGSDGILLDPCSYRVQLTRPGIRIDLGGIAKGYAADEALKVLRDHGFPQSLVDASGDLVVGAPPPAATGWRVVIEQLTEPDSPEISQPHRKRDVVLLANQAIATSGSTVQFAEIDGRHYSHIVDPGTGLGLQTHSMVTVIAPTGIQADSLASAVSVLGAEAGIRFIENAESDGVQVRVQSVKPSGQTNQQDSAGLCRYIISLP